MTVLPFCSSRCFAPGYPKRPSLKPSPPPRRVKRQNSASRSIARQQIARFRIPFTEYDVCAKKMRPGIKSSLKNLSVGKASKTERLFRGCKDGVSDVLLLTSAKEVSRTGKRQRCGLEVFALWGLFPSTLASVHWPLKRQRVEFAFRLFVLSVYEEWMKRDLS